jgi:hypothetical protein
LSALNIRETVALPSALSMTNRNANQIWSFAVDTDAVDDGNFGLYNGTANFSVFKVTTTGAAAFSSTLNAKAGSYINGASNSDWAFAVENTGTTNAHGLYVNIGASSTGIPFRVDKNNVSLFDIANGGAATFSSSVTATNGYISASYNASDPIIWGGIAPYANIYGALSWDIDKAIVKGKGGYGLGLYVDDNITKGITIATTGAATFSSSITATNGIFNNAAGGSIVLKYGGTDDWVVGENSGAATRDFNIYNFNRTSIELSISRATGTATFNGRISTPVGWTTIGRNYSHEWIEFPYNSGLYSPINSAHFYPNDGSYGAWKINGARNGYNGLEFGALTNGSVSLMIDINSNGSGFYNNTYGSQLFWSAGELQISKNNYGGGLIVAVLDAVNFNTYLDSSYLSLSGGTITGDLTVNNKVYIGTHGCYFQEVLISGVYELQVVDSAGNITVIS